MKKLFFLPYLMSATIAFCAAAEPKVVSAQIKKADGICIVKCGKCLEFSTLKFGSPYCVQIQNLTNKPIIVDQGIMYPPIATSQEIIQARRNELKIGSMLSALLGIGAGALSYYNFNLMRDPNTVYNPMPDTLARRTIFAMDPSLLGKINMGSAVVASLVSAYLLYKLTISESQEALEAKFAAHMLNAPFQIAPGETVKKIFWLKNAHDEILINVDALLR